MQLLQQKSGTLVMVVIALLSACKKDNDHRVVHYQINSASVATWKGYLKTGYLKTGYFNNGTIGVVCKDLKVQDGKVKSGSFVLPLSTIENENLPTDSLKHVLVHHLQTKDFFNMAFHPELLFEITRVDVSKGDAAGTNFVVNGQLTMVGVTRPISFPAKITIANKNISILADIPVDRTKWGIDFATDPALPDEARIMDNIDIHLDLSGSAK